MSSEPSDEEMQEDWTRHVKGLFVDFPQEDIPNTALPRSDLRSWRADLATDLSDLAEDRSSKSRPVVLISSPHARQQETSPFLRFVREHVDVLKRYGIESTRGTALALTGTGLYSNDDVKRRRAGGYGGLVEVAASVARGKCSAVILLIDARDPHHDDIQIEILKRIADKRSIRSIITYADAVNWAQFEVAGERESDQSTLEWDEPINWQPGYDNSPKPLRLEERTLGLTASNLSKPDLIEFVNSYITTLRRHHRIISTGTTGWLIKLLYANAEQEADFLSEAMIASGLRYLPEALQILELPPKRATDLPLAIDHLRNRFGVTEDPDFADKVMPLLPGPDGGDALLALEALKNECDTIVCLHEGSFPATDAIRMLAQTCQLPGVYTACLGNIRSAVGWVRGLEKEVSTKRPPVIGPTLREKFGLDEVVVVDCDDGDPEERDRALCLAAAGYLHAAVTRISSEGGGRIAVSWGQMARTVRDQLDVLLKSEMIQAPRAPSPQLVWSPAIGVLLADSSLGAESIAARFRDFYGGTVEGFARPGYVLEQDLQAEDVRLIDALRTADLVLQTAEPWTTESSLYKDSGASTSFFPGVEVSDAVGTIGGIFISRDGSEVSLKKGKLVGLDYVGLQNHPVTGKWSASPRFGSKRRSVILVSGGPSYENVIAGALNKRLCSVLITSKETARRLANAPFPEG